MKNLAEQKDVLRIVQQTLPQIDFSTERLLVDDGVLDSFSVMLLISALSMEYDIIFDVDNLTPENFNSISAITGTIRRLQQV